MREISSGITASDRTCQPYLSAASFSAGPPRSLYSPAVARSEMVMMPTVICISEVEILNNAEQLSSRAAQTGIATREERRPHNCKLRPLEKRTAPLDVDASGFAEAMDRL